MDPENSEGDGRNTCQLCRYFLFFWEFFNNNTKFQRKRGGRGPVELGQPLNPPVGVDSCCSSVLFSILASAYLGTCVLTWTPPLSPFLPYFFSPCEPCATKEEKLTYHCLVYGVVDWTGKRTEDATTWKLRNDETSPLRRLKEKDMTKENFHDTKKDQRCPEENSTMKRTRDMTTRRHGTDATKTTDNNSKNNFRILSPIWRHILPGTSNNSIAYWYLSL